MDSCYQYPSPTDYYSHQRFQNRHPEPGYQTDSLPSHLQLGRLFGTPVGKNEPRQGQGQGQDHEKVRRRRAALQLQMVLALTLILPWFDFPHCQGVPKSWPENGHETDSYKVKKQIDDMNLHKKTRRIQLE